MTNAKDATTAVRQHKMVLDTQPTAFLILLDRHFRVIICPPWIQFSEGSTDPIPFEHYRPLTRNHDANIAYVLFDEGVPFKLALELDMILRGQNSMLIDPSGTLVVYPASLSGRSTTQHGRKR